MAQDPPDLATRPIHLAGVVADEMPGFDGSPAWFEQYVMEHPEPGFLVTSFSFSEPWDSWEMHPHGHEVVLCVAGTMTLHQELPSGETRTVVLEEGQYAINEPGTWHTADVVGPSGRGATDRLGRGRHVGGIGLRQIGAYHGAPILPRCPRRS